jgi:hypothetical protein
MGKAVRDTLNRSCASAVLLLALLGQGACPAPGEGAKAELWYRRAAPVLAALERFKQERSLYPDTLAELPPEWLPAPAADEPATPNRGFQYARHGDRFELSFAYAGPGMNHCTFDSASTASKRWRCGGYY